MNMVNLKTWFYKVEDYKFWCILYPANSFIKEREFYESWNMKLTFFQTERKQVKWIQLSQKQRNEISQYTIEFNK